MFLFDFRQTCLVNELPFFIVQGLPGDKYGCLMVERLLIYRINKV